MRHQLRRPGGSLTFPLGRCSAITGFMSITGVPSMASRLATTSFLPSSSRGWRRRCPRGSACPFSVGRIFLPLARQGSPSGARFQSPFFRIYEIVDDLHVGKGVDAVERFPGTPSASSTWETISPPWSSIGSFLEFLTKAMGSIAMVMFLLEKISCASGRT